MPHLYNNCARVRCLGTTYVYSQAKRLEVAMLVLHVSVEKHLSQQIPAGSEKAALEAADAKLHGEENKQDRATVSKAWVREEREKKGTTPWKINYRCFQSDTSVFAPCTLAIHGELQWKWIWYTHLSHRRIAQIQETILSVMLKDKFSFKELQKVSRKIYAHDIWIISLPILSGRANRIFGDFLVYRVLKFWGFFFFI